MYWRYRKEVAMEHQLYNYVEVLRWAFPILQEKRLSAAERFLFLYLLHRTNATFWKKLYISAEKVAEDTGISRRSLFSYKKRLITLGFLLDEEGWALNFGKFPKKSKVENEGIKKYARTGVPAKRIPQEVFDRYEH